MGMLLALGIFVIVERTVAPRYSFVTPADDAIPFVPLTWGLYVLFFPFVVALSAGARENVFNKFKCSVVMAFILSIACFQFFPEVVPRPVPAAIDNAFLRARITRLWEMDLASNGLPSLHVSVTCLASHMAWQTRHRLVVHITGLSICLSTLTLKQHTLADVAGGVLMALCCCLVTERWQRREILRGRA